MRTPFIKTAAMTLLYLLPIYAWAGTWIWDRGGIGSNQGIWGTTSAQAQNWDLNTNPSTVSGVTPDVIFNNQFVSSNQSVSLRGGAKTVYSISFQGPYAYSLSTSDSSSITLNKGSGVGPATIGVYDSLSGNANQTVGVVVNATSNVQINNTTPSNTLSFTGNVNINANSMVVNNTGAITMSTLSGTGAITKQGSGTYTVTGSSSYSGNVTISEGTLQMNNRRSLGTTGNVSVQSGATLALNNTSSSITKTLTIAGAGVGGNGALRVIAGTGNNWASAVTIAGGSATVGVDTGAQLLISGNISGASQSLVKVGGGTLELRGDNTFNGIFTVNGGIAYLNGSGSNKPLKNINTVIINSGGTVLFGKSNQINTLANVQLNGGTLAMNGFSQNLNTLTLTSNSTLDLNCGTLTLADLTRTGGVLTVTGYSESIPMQFVVNQTLSSNVLNSIYFGDLGIMGAFQLADKRIVPAPEPSTMAIGIIAFLIVVYHAWSRWYKK